ncbi:hypothetical protein Tco_0923312 [Tanacetum coccineum]|uniref:Uncharacterized protein n=1 Tax=Tanacetum coccineum TaxID=301880 RepID=A0ABQ5D3Y7_9ASTR
MTDKEAKSTTRKIVTNDQANYYSVITSITVNGKNGYELKEKFLDDLHKNSFSGTNREDAVEHIEYFLKIVDLIDLPNVNRDKLGVVVFPISLVGDAWRWFDGIKGSITRALLDYWKLGSDKIEPTNEEPSDLEETDHDDEQEIGEIFRIETNMFDYETPLCSEWPTCSWREDGYCNGGNLPGAYIVGNTLHYQEFEWYDALKDIELKEEALRNKVIMEGLIDEDVEPNNEGWKSWDDFENTNGDRKEREWELDEEVWCCEDANMMILRVISKDACEHNKNLSHDEQGWMVNQRDREEKEEGKEKVFLKDS